MCVPLMGDSAFNELKCIPTSLKAMDLNGSAGSACNVVMAGLGNGTRCEAIQEAANESRPSRRQPMNQGQL